MNSRTPQPVRLYGETRRFSQESEQYNYPLGGVSSLGIEELRGRIAEKVSRLARDEVLTLSFAGFPGVGKTSQLRHMVSASTLALGGGKAPLHVFVHPESGGATPAGRRAKEGSVGVIHGDHMFRAIGPDRRGVMLSSKENFHHLWADDDRLARIFWSVVEGRNPTDHIYLGSQKEKGMRSPLGELRVIEEGSVGKKKVMIIEGVQAIEVLPRVSSLRSRYRVETMKILFDVSLLDSMIRLLRREHDEKKHPDGSPYSFREILEHRLLEQYYILETFIGPASQDPETLFLHKPREMPPFRHDERSEILKFLRSYMIPPVYASQAGLVKFVYGLIARLDDYFTRIEGVDESEYIAWKQARTEKKKRQVIEASS